MKNESRGSKARSYLDSPDSAKLAEKACDNFFTRRGNRNAFISGLKAQDECVTIKGLLKNLDFKVTGVSCNSKLTRPGNIFVAIKGARLDGAAYIDEAVKRGAKAVISEGPVRASGFCASPVLIRVKDARKALGELASQFYNDPSAKIKVVGVTGTNGKTTITYLLESLLKERNLVPAVIGTINYRFKGKAFPSKNTTPGPCELQALLADMLKAGVDYCVMEVSSHALHQERVRGICFHSAVFTNLTQDHLDYHLTMKSYFESKAALFRNLSKEAFAVINHDDPFGRKLEKLTKARIVTYGLKRGAQLGAKKIRFDCRRTDLTLVAGKQELACSVPLVGIHNLYNILASAAWACEAGMGFAAIKKSLEHFGQVPGRLERVEGDADFTVYVDYAHTEDALKNILTALRGLASKRIILVFGCGGERDRTKRPKMGRVATEMADLCVITSDNPRSEDPQGIIRDIKRGIKKENFTVILDRGEAIKKALSMARPRDIVVVAGKGHENYQVFEDRTVAFNDKEIIKKCLKSKNF